MPSWPAARRASPGHPRRKAEFELAKMNAGTSPGHDERREWRPSGFQVRRISYLRSLALGQL
jgi:hypothetical protein